MSEQLMRPGHHTTMEGEAAKAYARLQRDLMRQDFSGMAERIAQRGSFDSILHVGAGAGFLAIELLEKSVGSQVTLLESSETLLSIAQDNLQVKGLVDRAQFVKWASLPLALPDGSIDLAVSMWEFHHWMWPDKVLAELHRVLRFDGICLFIDIVSDASDQALKKMTAHAPEGIRKGIVSHAKLAYSASEIQGIVERCWPGRTEIVFADPEVRIELRRT